MPTMPSHRASASPSKTTISLFPSPSQDHRRIISPSPLPSSIHQSSTTSETPKCKRNPPPFSQCRKTKTNKPTQPTNPIFLLPNRNPDTYRNLPPSTGRSFCLQQSQNLNTYRHLPLPTGRNPFPYSFFYQNASQSLLRRSPAITNHTSKQLYQYCDALLPVLHPCLQDPVCRPCHRPSTKFPIIGRYHRYLERCS